MALAGEQGATRHSAGRVHFRYGNRPLSLKALLYKGYRVSMYFKDHSSYPSGYPTTRRGDCLARAMCATISDPWQRIGEIRSPARAM